VASTRELGFPNLDLRGWNGFFAPKGTPEPVIARLQREIAAAAKHPDLQKRMTDVGAEPSGSSQAEMREMLREQIAKVRPMGEAMVGDLKRVMQWAGGHRRGNARDSQGRPLCRACTY